MFYSAIVNDKVNLNFNHQAGRDRHIWATDLRHPENRTLICVESAPILKMILTPNGKGLWVSTSESHVKYWDIQPAVDIHYSNVSTYNQQSPTNSLHHAQAASSKNRNYI